MSAFDRCCAGKGSVSPTMRIISRRERMELTLADKLAQFPKVLAAWDALAAAGAAIKTAQAAKTAALVKARFQSCSPNQSARAHSC